METMGHRAETARRKSEISRPIIEQIGKLIRDVDFGEVVITIHDSRIVQLEKREKTRIRDA